MQVPSRASFHPGFDTFPIRGGDQSHFTIANPNQVVKITWSINVTGCFEYILVRPHVALNIGPELRQQRFEYSPGGRLMIAVLGGGRMNIKNLFEICDADPLGPPDGVQAGQSPGFILHHFTEKGQSNRDHLSILSKPRNDSLQEARLFRRELAHFFRQLAKRTSERHKDFFGMV